MKKIEFIELRKQIIKTIDDLRINMGILGSSTDHEYTKQFTRAMWDYLSMMSDDANKIEYKKIPEKI